MNNSNFKKRLYILVFCLVAVSGFIFYIRIPNQRTLSTGKLDILTKIPPKSNVVDSYSESKKFSTTTNKEISQTTRVLKIPGNAADNFKIYENYLKDSGYIVQSTMYGATQTIIAQKGDESFVMTFTADENDLSTTIAKISYLEVIEK